MYIPGRRRTASRPSRTVMSLALYPSLPRGTERFGALLAEEPPPLPVVLVRAPALTRAFAATSSFRFDSRETPTARPVPLGPSRRFGASVQVHIRIPGTAAGKHTAL